MNVTTTWHVPATKLPDEPCPECGHPITWTIECPCGHQYLYCYGCDAIYRLTEIDGQEDSGI